IDSEPGVGTTVRLYLPRLSGSLADERPAEKAPAPEPAAPTILLVEDDHDVRSYVVEILRELHFRVLEAHDADSALGLIERNDVKLDLLLTDVVLPGMSGKELAEEVTARQPNTKVLFMTGYAPEAIMLDRRLDPGTEMLQKPLDPNVLEQRIFAVLEARR